MPFVIPRVSVPLGVNSINATAHQSYTSEPSIADLEKYEEWLVKELELVRAVIETNKEKTT